MIRPPGIYGPRNVDDISCYFITSFAKKSLATMMLIGSGSNVVKFVHVKDAAQGFYLTLEKDGSWGLTYFISENGWHSYSEVYKILSGITGRKAPTVTVPKQMAKALVYPVHLARIASGNWHFMWDPKTVDAVTTDRAYSIEKARKELGYTPRYSLEEGLRETVQWYRQNGMI